jgi:branched-chain amino acid transport system substrate-binding protein
MQKRLALILPAALLLGLAGAATPTIKIAVASPFTGDNGSYGVNIKRGAELALDNASAELNKLGLNIELIERDDKTDKSQGLKVAKELTADASVLGVIGHATSGVTIAATAIYDTGKLVTITPTASNPEVTSRGLASVNRMCGRDDVQGPAGAEFASKTLKAKRVFVVVQETAYGQGLAKGFQERAKALGITSIKVASVASADSVKLATRNASAFKPDLVYLAGDIDLVDSLKSFKAANIEAKYLGGDALDSGEFVEKAGSAVAGMFFTSIYAPADQYPNAAQLTAKYKARYGTEPAGESLLGYDAASSIIKAIESAYSSNGKRIPSREQVAAAMRKTNFSGVTGTISFNANGDRNLADYFIGTYEKASYPGSVIKAFKVAPPTAANQ